MIKINAFEMLQRIGLSDEKVRVTLFSFFFMR